MTPYSIAGMAKLNGLSLVALTDHNTCGNCRTFFDACNLYNIVPVPGMELTTAEDIHIICLLPTLEQADAFETQVRLHRILVPNRPEIFGRQLKIGVEDEIIGEEAHLLINATDLPLAQAAALAQQHGAAVYPAHIDREGNGILSILGELPAEPEFAAVEFHDAANVLPYETRYGLRDKRKLVSSDAHRLWELSAGEQSIGLDCAEADPDCVRRTLIQKLRGCRV